MQSEMYILTINIYHFSLCLLIFINILDVINMSIYSGFATRSLESTYNKYLGEMINLFQSYLLMYLKKGEF